MLVECGFVRATTGDGQEFTFRPSFGRIAALGSPQDIVKLYAALHESNAAAEAAYVLACLCDQDDATPLIGYREVEVLPAANGSWRRWIVRRLFGRATQARASTEGWRPGAMPEAELVIIARHLMQHGIVGKAKPGTGDGKFSDRFEAASFISAARVHLGLSSADAEALSMTEFQDMLAMKFPETRPRDVPTREEYEAGLAAVDAIRAVRDQALPSIT